MSCDEGSLIKLFSTIQNRNHKIDSANIVKCNDSYCITLSLLEDARTKTLVKYLEQSFFVECVSWK